MLCRKEGFEISNLGEKVPGLKITRGSISGWKNGSVPRANTVKLIADYFGVSVDYLLGLADNPNDFDSDNLSIEIPSSYIEAANGDIRKARATMLCGEREAQKKIAQKNNSRFSKQDSDLIFALWGDDDEIDEKDVDDVKRFAAFIKERKQDK